MIEVYEPYVAVLLVVLVVGALAGVILLASHVLGPRRPTREKGIPYESGVDPLAHPRQRFSVKFYLTAILFLVFDLEVVFLFPWAVKWNDFLADDAFAPTAFWGMAFFLLVLGLGLLYEWRRGAMKWSDA